MGNFVLVLLYKQRRKDEEKRRGMGQNMMTRRKNEEEKRKAAWGLTQTKGELRLGKTIRKRHKTLILYAGFVGD